MIGSGANLNCLAEGLVLSKYYSKTAQMLSTADGSQLHIDYKLSDAVVCNNGVCFETPFHLVKNMAQAAILGTPFISLLFPISIDHKGISTNKEGIEVRFDFISEPRYQGVNHLLKHKEDFLFFLKQELEIKKIEEHLKDEKFKLKVKAYQEDLSKEIYSTDPTAF